MSEFEDWADAILKRYSPVRVVTQADTAPHLTIPPRYETDKEKMLRQLEEVKKIMPVFADTIKPCGIFQYGITIQNYKIKSILVNKAKGVTTVMFENGDKKMVKCADGTEFDTYSAVAAAIAEEVYGTNSAFKRMIDEKSKVIPKKKPKTRIEKAAEEVVCSVTDMMEDLAQRVEKLEEKNERSN